MGLLKGQNVDSRCKLRQAGLDFSLVEAIHFAGNPGETIKFYGGATMGFNETADEWRSGILIKNTLTAGTLSGGEYKGKYGKSFSITANTTSDQDGHTQGAALAAAFTREAGYDHTGGSEDIAVRFQATNYSSLASGGIRGLNVESTNRTGTVAKVQGVLITARQRNTGGFTTGIYGLRVVTKNQQPGNGTGYQHALEVADESDGVQPALNSIVWIEKQSNSYTLATRAAIEIVNNCNASYSQAITSAIYLKSGASGSNITNVLAFDSADGTDGFTAVTNGGAQGNVDGYFTIYDVTNSKTLYVLGYDTVPS